MRGPIDGVLFSLRPSSLKILENTLDFCMMYVYAYYVYSVYEYKAYSANYGVFKSVTAALVRYKTIAGVAREGGLQDLSNNITFRIHYIQLLLRVTVIFKQSLCTHSLSSNKL